MLGDVWESIGGGSLICLKPGFSLDPSVSRARSKLSIVVSLNMKLPEHEDASVTGQI